MDQVGFSTEVENIKEYENEQTANFLRSQIDMKSQGQSTAGFTETQRGQSLVTIQEKQN